MLALYLFCAGLGIPLIALFAFGGADGDAELGDAGFDLDIDADAGFDLDVGADADLGAGFDNGGALSGVGDFTGLIRRVPVSSYAFFMAFFGAAGSLGTWFGVGFLATIVLAVSLGLISAFVNTAAFSFLRNTESNSQLTDRQLEGRIATVSVPIAVGKRGRVWLDTGEERVQLTADSIESASDQSYDRGEEVLIVRMANGVAQVMGVDTDLSD